MLGVLHVEARRKFLPPGCQAITTSTAAGCCCRCVAGAAICRVVPSWPLPVHCNRMMKCGGTSLAVFLMSGSLRHATIFERIQGIVHDPQHRPVAGASVTLQAIASDFSQSAQANDDGEFSFTNLPVGDYKITVA